MLVTHNGESVFGYALTDLPLEVLRNERTFTVRSGPDPALQQAEIVLAGAKALADKQYGPESFGLPSRIELVSGMDGEDAAGGLFVFCPYDDGIGEHLLLEVSNALLGYHGSGPNLTRQLLTFLDVPKGMIYAINRAVWHVNPYVVVITVRQYVTFSDHTKAPIWDWHRVR